jgi:hypothetical protein
MVIQCKRANFIPCEFRIAVLRDSATKRSWSTLSTSSVLKVSLLTLLVSLSLGFPLALLTAFPARAAGQGDSSVTSQGSEPLAPFTGSVASESTAPPSGQMGLDMGTNTFSFSVSRVSWARSTGNMTMSPLASVNASATIAQLTPTTEKNSTIIDFSYSHSLGAASFSQNLIVKNTTNPYDREIVLLGSLTGPTVTLTETIRLENLGNFPASDCDSGCTQQCFGTMCFDWTGDAATYNNQTDVVTFTLGSSFTVDPLAVDGSGKCNPTASSCNISLTTTGSPDLIVVACGVPDTGSGNAHCTKPTSSATGLGSFSFRASEALSTTNNVTEWYAVASNTLTAATITCNLSASTNFGCNVFGISDSNTASPFDSNAALPAKNTGTTSSKPTVSTVSTSNANDMLIGLTEDKGSTTQTGGTCAGSSCTLIQSTAGAPVVATEKLVVASTQSSQSVAFGTLTGSGNSWAMIVDAVKQAYVTQPITCTTANSAPDATMTLSGASVSPTTLACDGTAHNFTADPSQVITLTVPTDGSTTRYRLAAGATSTTVTACPSGTCTGDSFTIYYQYSQSVSYAIDSCDSGATCSAPNLSYTQSGSSTYSTLSTSASTYWIDYGTTATVPSSLTDSLGDFYYPYTYSWSITTANVISNPVTYWCGL